MRLRGFNGARSGGLSAGPVAVPALTPRPVPHVPERGQTRSALSTDDNRPASSRVDVRRTRTLRGLVKASSSGGGAAAPHSGGSRVEGVEAGGYQQKVSSGPQGCEGGWSLNHGWGGMNMQSFHPRNLQPRFYSSSAVRPLAPFDSAPPPEVRRLQCRDLREALGRTHVRESELASHPPT